MKRVAITGAGGFIGRALTAKLLARGYGVIALGRNLARDAFPPGVEVRRFDPNAPEPQPEAFHGADAVVHLAGESVAGRWTEEKKRRIRDSRVNGTRLVIASLPAAPARPAVLVCSSATGYYGDRGDDPLGENATPGSDFLARTCVDWERVASVASGYGMRAVQLRTGIVLGRGGALAKMAPVFRMGVGGPFGNGKQFVPWIHIDDLTELYVFALENAAVEGAINAVAPDYATSARFAQALGAAVKRPALLPAPAFALRAVLGEFASTLLASQLVLPAAAQRHGFTWRHGRLESAVADALAQTTPWPVLRVFEDEQFVPLSAEQTFPFFAKAENLRSITPPSLRFTIRNSPVQMRQGTLISYRLRVRGVPMRWKTMIAQWNPPHGFDDVQLRGPYALWHHEHRFEPVSGGVKMTDRVTYALPHFPLGNAVLPLVRRDVAQIFAYRRKAIENLVHSTI
ncbi:MAG TPA: TIGR01777 family oxidoreductase [Candidatus Baltobacteraceae bacterium]|jgi:hypothetical protein|nr:TIGR01777 family oxidoreductase [Candidatus Baltobacteraceae bacterium]